MYNQSSDYSQIISQVALGQEGSSTSKSCKHQNDVRYDDCVYKVIGDLLKENFNCTFEFLSGADQSSNNQQKIQECALMDLLKSDQEAVRDTVFGKMVFYSKSKTI